MSSGKKADEVRREYDLAKLGKGTRGKYFKRYRQGSKRRKRKALEADGWKVGTTQQFLRLSDEEATLIDLKLALGRALKERRTRQRLSQAAVAARIRSSQSRVAKMESGDSTVSIDLLVRTLLALGVSRKDLAKSLT